MTIGPAPLCVTAPCKHLGVGVDCAVFGQIPEDIMFGKDCPRFELGHTVGKAVDPRVELSHRAAKAINSKAGRAVDLKERQEFADAVMDAESFDSLEDKWKAIILAAEAEQN